MIVRGLGLAYAATAFVSTWIFFIWFVIFLGNIPKQSSPWVVPSVDHGAPGDPLIAAVVNALLLSLFCLQHSLMARLRFKQALTTVLPPELERATYVHAANLAGFVFLLIWTPIPTPLWSIENDAAKAAIWVAFGSGWLILFLAALSINVWELLGLRQAWFWYRRRRAEPLKLKSNWLYRHLEHPMYVGVLLGFWMTPHMTVGHALLAAQLTIYIAIGMRYERRDLERKFGSAYARWRGTTRAQFLHDPARIQIGSELKRRLDPIASEQLPRRMAELLVRI